MVVRAPAWRRRRRHPYRRLDHLQSGTRTNASARSGRHCWAARARAGHAQRRMHAHAAWPHVRAGTGGQRMRRISHLPSHRLRRAQRLAVHSVTEIFVDVICSTISRMRWIARPRPHRPSDRRRRAPLRWHRLTFYEAGAPLGGQVSVNGTLEHSNLRIGMASGVERLFALLAVYDCMCRAIQTQLTLHHPDAVPSRLTLPLWRLRARHG